MKNSGSASRIIFIFALILGVTVFAPHLSAQVNQDELRSVGPVEFINYEGPHTRIETRAQITQIGSGLGQIIREGAVQTGALGRYFVIHSVSAEDGTKLDADIFGLGVDVGVDHIWNLRLIIQGYLQAAYQYSERDAALLAEFITIYNAAYRGDWTYFSNRYKSPVMSSLTRERAGLSIRYDEWPGQTLMLIPLGTGLGGPLSAIDTSVVSDQRVTDQLRQEPGMGLEQRRDMVDLMEREADRAAQEASITREAIRQEEQQIAQEREQVRQEDRQIAQEQRQIEQERQRPGADQEALDQRQQEVERRQDELEQRRDDIEQREQELAEQREDAERLEAFAEQRITDAQERREEIAEDQQRIIDSEPQVVAVAGALGVAIGNQDSALGRLVLLNNTGNVTRQSPLNTVNARTVTIVNNRIFAIAGETRGDGAIRLVEMNANTLDMQRQGENDIAPGSLLWVAGQDIYAIVTQGGNLNMARFNTDLVLQARSAITVHPFASAFVHDGFLLTQRSDGSAVLLDPRELTERR